MQKRTGRTVLLAAMLAVFALFAAACGNATDTATDDTSPTTTAADLTGSEVTVYSGRSEELVKPLLQQFEQETGVKVNVKYGDSPELASLLTTEGANSPADVFFAQDAGSLGVVSEAGLLETQPKGTLELVPEQFRAENGDWIGTSGRARVIVYNTADLKADQVPDSVFGLTDPKWKGKIGVAPSNGSFQAFVAAMLNEIGAEKTEAWLEGLKANDPKIYAKNGQIVEGVANGEVQLGLVNHYYLLKQKKEQGDVPAENKFLKSDDPGSLVNVAGVGVLKTAKNKAAAEAFVNYLLSEQGQNAVVTATSEYPVVEGVAGPQGVPGLGDVSGIKVDLSALGPSQTEAVDLIKQAGLL
jgi:iron(III) transport system substrate-binding protein